MGDHPCDVPGQAATEFLDAVGIEMLVIPAELGIVKQDLGVHDGQPWILSLQILQPVADGAVVGFDCVDDRDQPNDEREAAVVCEFAPVPSNLGPIVWRR